MIDDRGTPRNANCGGHHRRFRVVNGQRRAARIFQLDDGRAGWEASASEAVITFRDLLRTMNSWSSAAACRWGQWFRGLHRAAGVDLARRALPLRGNTCAWPWGHPPPDGPPAAQFSAAGRNRARRTAAWPARAPGAACTEAGGAVAELQLGGAYRTYPTDAALAAGRPGRWRPWWSMNDGKPAPSLKPLGPGHIRSSCNRLHGSLE